MPILLLLAACDTAPTEVVRAPVPAVGGEGVVLETVVTRAPQAVPAWAASPYAGGWGVSGAPDAVLVHGACTDGPGAREALLAALRADALEELPSFGCPEPGWCRWVADTVRADDPALGVAYTWLPWCAAEVQAAALEGSSAPPHVVVDRAYRTGVWDPRLQDIAASVPDPGAPPIEWVASALAEVDGPEAERVLLGLLERAPRDDRDPVALSLWGRRSAEARRAFDEVCARVDDDRCGFVRVDALTRELEGIRDGELAPAGVYTRFPLHRSAVTSALSACATLGDPACLAELARADRAAAARIAEEIADPLAEVLSRSRAEIVTALEAAGFVGLQVPDDSDAVSVPELLVAAGRAVRVAEPWSWPPDHTGLLLRLAAAAGASELVFGELAPLPEGWEVLGREPQTTLYAWAGGWRWRTLVRTEAGWDLPRTVGFLNTVLAARGSPNRVALDDVRATVIAGPPAALERLESEGWVRFTRPAALVDEAEAWSVTPTAGPPVELEPVEE